jgi:8-hydroxy-5-deazaflavin:NADPH oxidoreductase
MKIGVLGTGSVGNTLATKFAALGHEVRMGARDAKNPKAAAWAQTAGAKASAGTFADAAKFGEIVFNCTSGMGALDALSAAGADNLRGKVLVDVANPLDFSRGMPPSLFTGSNDSLGERIQKAFPETRVVKALNTVNAEVMVDPKRVPGVSDVFVCGNDAGAKAEVTRILKEWLGWPAVVDLGDITGARGTEAYLLLWLRLWGAFGTPHLNVHVVH